MLHALYALLSVDAGLGLAGVICFAISCTALGLAWGDIRAESLR